MDGRNIPVVQELSMKFVFLLSVIIVFILGGCSVERIVTASEMDWKPPKLTMQECPNLNGNYTYKLMRNYSGAYESDLIHVYAGSIYVLWKTANNSPTTGRPQTPLNYSTDILDSQSYYIEPRVKKKETTNIDSKNITYGTLHLEQTATTLIQGRQDEARVVTKLGTEMSGCSGGALILRHLEYNGGNDFVPRTASYGEFELRKGSDASLIITERRRQRAISFSSGMLGEPNEYPAVTRFYQLANP
ncbi:hypothetical protein QTH98_28150 [Variovorax sp. J22G47]|nr:hypothetical protein [Variovorax sp. J22R193]MDM0059572.1 hypothetical protein [Variovorax sp. J22G47]